MYSITKGIHIDFAHHVHGHKGACINIHGHTWLFEVTLQASILQPPGFVADFGDLKKHVLTPVHQLLDHGLALFEGTVEKAREEFKALGKIMMDTRPEEIRGYNYGDPKLGYDYRQFPTSLNGASNRILNGIKLAVFPFIPTSEKLAEWLYGVAEEAVMGFDTGIVTVRRARIYETLHPVQAYADYER